MSEAFKAHVDELPEFVAAMRAAPQTLNTELFRAARRIAKRGEALSKVYVKFDTGATAGSIWSDASQFGDRVVAEWGASSEAAIFMDKGRRPGAQMPPQGALLPWMVAHGIPASAEFAVRRKIARDGIPPHPFVSRAHTEMRKGFYAKEFGDAVKRTIAKIRSAA